MIDAFKRASAGRITAVIPFYAYGRSDKKDQPRVPITARLIADMITVAGADRVLTMDLHQGQIQGFFNIPVDELTAVHMLSNYFLHKHLDNPVVVTDLGFAKRARAFAEALDAPLAVIEKRRIGNLDRAELMNVIGDVRGRRAIIVDDEIDTAGTLIEIVRALEREGVTEIYACATHGVLSDPAVDRLRESPLREVVLTDTVPLPPAKRISQITTISVAPLIGEAIKRIHRGESVGALFSSEVSFTQEMLLWEDGVAKTLRCPSRAGPRRRRRCHGRTRSELRSRARVRDPRGRPMSLQLHRPDGKGAVEPRPVVDPNWRRQLRSPRWGAGRQGRPAPGAPEHGDEPDVDADVGAVLGGPRGADVRAAGRGLRVGLLERGASNLDGLARGVRQRSVARGRQRCARDSAIPPACSRSSAAASRSTTRRRATSTPSRA